MEAAVISNQESGVSVGAGSPRPNPPARCQCGGKEFKFLGLQKGRKGHPELSLWNCKACHTTLVGPCMHTQKALLEIKDGKETWICWLCGIALTIPHRFKSST